MGKINPIVGVCIPIIRIPIKGGMTIPNTRSGSNLAHIGTLPDITGQPFNRGNGWNLRQERVVLFRVVKMKQGVLLGVGGEWKNVLKAKEVENVIFHFETKPWKQRKIAVHMHPHANWCHCYCWWLKSCTTWDVWNPINNGKNYLSTGAGFQPSAVFMKHVTFASLPDRFLHLIWLCRWCVSLRKSPPLSLAESEAFPRNLDHLSVVWCSQWCGMYVVYMYCTFIYHIS